MSWNLTANAERYAQQALPLLLAEPDRNTVPLTVLDTVRAGQTWSDTEPLFGWYQDGPAVTGAFSITPPYGILLAVLPCDTELELVTVLRERGTPVPDVFGSVAEVERFVNCWTAGTGLATEIAMRHRLYTLDRLRPPVPASAGAARVAELTDLDLVMSWASEFLHEAEPSSVEPSRQMYHRRVELKLILLWETPAGEPVSMAARSVMIAGVSRIGPVYTPPAFRRHGYGAAVTAACTQDALDQGAAQVVLFTDLANPTSNAIYQKIGYRPVDDRMIVRFLS